MTHLEILLAFGIPPAEIAPDLIVTLTTPAFATLISRTTSNHSARHAVFQDFSLALPHEIWLAQQFGLQQDGMVSDAIPLALANMQSMGLAPDAAASNSEHWFVLNPVHIHIARDHLVLTDQRQLSIDEAESRALFNAALPYFQEMGYALLYGDARSWFVRADDWRDFQTGTPDAACGHNVTLWMPQGQHALQWRKLQNEIHMLWHAHPVNEARAECGLPAINSIWLWGGASATQQQKTASSITDVFNLSDWNAGYQQFCNANLQHCSVADIIQTQPQHGLLTLDGLIAPALANDWSDWLAQWQVLEENWFAPLLAALQAGRIGQISLTLSNSKQLSTLSTTRNSLRKFWLRPTLKNLLP
jgi:hypothetical protein